MFLVSKRVVLMTAFLQPGRERADEAVFLANAASVRTLVCETLEDIAMAPSGFVMQAIPLLMVFFVFYVVVIRPGRVTEGKRWLAVQELKGAERVLLSCGILGTFVMRHGDAEAGEYEIEVADGIRIRVVEEGIKVVIPQELTSSMDISSVPDPLEEPAPSPIVSSEEAL
jgi:preprotein translocase subunit YajC